MLRAVLRGIAAVGVCAALLVGSLMTWAGSGASAQEPAHVLYGKGLVKMSRAYVGGV